MQSQTSLLSVPEDQRLSFSGRKNQQQHQPQQQQQNLNAQIIDLLHEVLPPDEDLNTVIDEMMEEYLGREDQLLNSLKRMHQDEDDTRRSSSSSTSTSTSKVVDGPSDPDDFIFDDDDIDDVDDDDDDESGNGGSIEIFEDDSHRYHEDGRGASSSDNDGNGRNDDNYGEEGTWASDDDDDDDEHDDAADADAADGGFDVDRWKEVLDSQLDESSSSRSNRVALGPLDTQQQHQHEQRRGHDKISNPQSGVGGMLKSPPEQLGNIRREEEKKNDSSPHQKAYYEYVDQDQDENDFLPPSSKLPPSEVGTESLRNFRQISALSNLDSFVSFNDDDDATTSRSEFPDSFISNIGDDEDKSNSDSFLSRDAAGDTNVSNGNDVSRGQGIVVRSLRGDNASRSQSEVGEEEEEGGGRRSIAILKLRVWDPARPRVRLKWHASTHIILPNQSNYAEATTEATTTKDATSRGNSTPDPRQNQNSATTSSSSTSSMAKGTERLSMVMEEPSKPVHRGDSYFEDDDGNDNNDNGDGNNNSNSNNNNNNNPLWGVGRSKLSVGTLVGIQLDATNNSSSVYSKQHNTSNNSMSSSITSFNGKRNYEWNIDNSINVHRINLIPLHKLSILHSKMEPNCNSLRELVMDGLPLSMSSSSSSSTGGGNPQSLSYDAAELIFEALGTNTSIHRFSMRHSQVNDVIGSLLALALVENTTLTQLNLQGNAMTNVSAKNFYSVLKKNNETLRLLDLNDNPSIDGDVGLALDQFMSQRALKRRLTNKAEKARRAARGLSVDATLEEDYYGDGDVDLGDGGAVTVVCAQDTVEEVLRGSRYGGGGGGREEDDDDENIRRDEQIIDDSSSTKMMPRPDEDFRDFMLRMDEEKENNNVSPSYHRQLMEESFHDREAFDNFSGGGSSVVSPSSSSSSRQYPLVRKGQFAQEEEASLLEEEEDARSSPNDNVDSNESTGSSITTRSAHRSGTEKDIIMTTTSSSSHNNNNNEGGGRSIVGRGVPSAWRMKTMETLQSADEDDSVESQESTTDIHGRKTITTTNTRNSPGRMYDDTVETRESNPRMPPERSDTVETQESVDDDRAVIRRGNNRQHAIDAEQSLMKDASSANNEAPLPRSAAAAPPARPTLPGAVRHESLDISQGDYVTEKAGERSMRRLVANTTHGEHSAFPLPGAVRHESLDISEGDYITEKAGERSMRRLVANTTHGEHGAFQIDETAPARQNRGGGGRRAARVRRTVSQRMARMAELEAGGGGAGASGTDGGEGEEEGVTMDADIERADDSFMNEMFGQMDSRRRSSRFSLIGLEGEDDGLDRKIVGIIGVLLVGLLVMVVVLMMNKGR